MIIILQGLIAGLGTLLGALFILCFRKLEGTSFSFLLSLASGIMTFVILIDLLPSALKLGGFKECAAGYILGILIVFITDRIINYSQSAQNKHTFLSMGYLIAIGIAMHDMPEGLAIAAGYSGSDKIGPMIALAIGLHNIPEGMVTAAPLKAGGASRIKIILINLFVSMITPAGTALGLLLINMSFSLVSMLLAFAAGAMSYIVLDKLIPSSRSQGKNIFLPGLILGFIIMYGIKLFFE